MKKNFKWNDFFSFIASQEIACLSTVNKNQEPETRAMLNLANLKNFPKLKSFFFSCVLYFTTNKSSDKMRQILNSGKSSVYFGDNNSFQGLLLTGTVEVVNDKELKQSFWHDCWAMYYKKGLKDPQYQILKFSAKKYKYYDGKLSVFKGALG